MRNGIFRAETGARLRTACAALVATAVVIAGCSNAAPGTTPISVSATQPSGTHTTATTSSSTTASAHNAADVQFAQMMIVHHRGAIEMADLVPDRAASQKVKDLGVEIKAAQAPEIQLMTSWLQAWGEPLTAIPGTAATSMGGATGGMGHGGHMGTTSTSTATGEMSMPGMMSEAEMAELKGATGASFEKLFLQEMIAHHQGALEMAETELAEGSNREALALAQRIKSSQSAEIAEMQQLLQTL